jgi:hypothetical protein
MNKTPGGIYIEVFKQPPNRPAAIRGEALLNLAPLLGNVYVHRDTSVTGDSRNAL